MHRDYPGLQSMTQLRNFRFLWINKLNEVIFCFFHVFRNSIWAILIATLPTYISTIICEIVNQSVHMWFLGLVHPAYNHILLKLYQTSIMYMAHLGFFERCEFNILSTKILNEHFDFAILLPISNYLNFRGNRANCPFRTLILVFLRRLLLSELVMAVQMVMFKGVMRCAMVLTYCY